MEATPRSKNETDNYLTKSPHWTHGDRAGLEDAGLKPVDETLAPHGVGGALRRTQIVASRKTTNFGSVDE